ncbi:acyl-CoA reductase [Empedobacter brevis NBRC 14943 = ATCC 43319]|uniref:Acyl-CoA reductase n=1 Tax=Empedobacter brevis NBRC 14943 = ATCC 43319 TaxID=1218108 RepID=A0A511NLH6_9FLAO|nr:acyl-CoA reductase [Empedobacter brevis]GEM53643.1 acyl-CoA reductase [Empedobacter brevis NBRC 14943 = ATCC 43319]
MTFEQRISAFNELGQFFNFIINNYSTQDKELAEKFEDWKDDAAYAISDAEAYNNWFTKENIILALKNWSEALTTENLHAWTKKYPYAKAPKNVGIIMAGNLPLVGFHDLLSVVISGNNALIKTSSKDDKLIQLVIKFLYSVNEEFKTIIQTVERLEDFEAVIATGSNNTARYFEQYFGKVPHIIRKNRTSVAVLDGLETEEDLKKLGDDLFIYYGLGCRNVTKLYVKDEAQLPNVFEAIFPWGEMVINHPKYANNYDYNRAIYLLGKDEFLDNNFVLLKKDSSLHSPIAVVNYETYTDINEVKHYLAEHNDQIQCVVGNEMKDNPNHVEFGQTQFPKLTDYADNIDTLKFLAEL